RVGGEVDLHLGVGRDSGADVAALDDDAAAVDDSALEVEKPSTHLGHGAHGRDGTGDLGGPDRGGHVDAVDGDRRGGRVGAGHDLGLTASGGHGTRVVDRDVVAQHPPGDGAIHRAGVEVAQPE